MNLGHFDHVFITQIESSGVLMEAAEEEMATVACRQLMTATEEAEGTT